MTWIGPIAGMVVGAFLMWLCVRDTDSAPDLCPDPRIREWKQAHPNYTARELTEFVATLP